MAKRPARPICPLLPDCDGLLVAFWLDPESEDDRGWAVLCGHVPCRGEVPGTIEEPSQ